MQTEVIGSPRAARVAAFKGFGIGALVMGLVALMAVAAIRESAKPKAEQAAASASAAHAERPAVTAEEEAYARALWPVHAQVKQDAVKMIFAGIAYKMGDIKRDAMKQRVAPLVPAFETAGATLEKIRVPASMAALHDEYRQAVRLYRDAASTMVKVATDGRDEHLIEAQAMSEKASGLTLKVGDVLWPGEFKPN